MWSQKPIVFIINFHWKNIKIMVMSHLLKFLPNKHVFKNTKKTKNISAVQQCFIIMMLCYVSNLSIAASRDVDVRLAIFWLYCE